MKRTHQSTLNFVKKKNISDKDDTVVSHELEGQASPAGDDMDFRLFDNVTPAAVAAPQDCSGDKEFGVTDDNDDAWPDLWTATQKQEFMKKNTWLGAKRKKLGCEICKSVRSLGIFKEKGLAISEEWASFSIETSGTGNRDSLLAVMRNKIRRHLHSKAHELAQKIFEQKQNDSIGQLIETMSETILKETAAIFRTVYYLAKNNRPFDDHEHLIELQKLNGVDLGKILHSRYSSTKIVEHIATEMRKRIVKNIMSSSSKLSVLIDESTTLGRNAVMIVTLKASVKGESPEFIFLELVELESQNAQGIESALLACLQTAGFTEEWLKAHWVSFVSDGASVMLGRKSGVAVRLKEKFPNLLTSHCMNHRLELAVSDSIDTVSSVNHFKVFMEKLHNLFSQSSKNQRQLLEAAAEVGSQVLRIGRILDVRWVASSFKAVEAVWTSLGALNQHFESASNDESRQSRERQMYKGLLERVRSPEFICDLGLMYDTLQELSNLSLELQSRSVTLLRAEHLLKRTVRVLTTFKDFPGEKYGEALKAKDSGHFKTVPLSPNSRAITINAQQFLQSLIDNIEKRLCPENEVLVDISVLDKSKWPVCPSIRYGEVQVRRLCRRFSLCTDTALSGMRDLIENPDREPDNLKALLYCMQTFPCSTAECERGFSLMNNICTVKRATLLVSNISNLMMINLNGPPLALFDPQKYALSWAKTHRIANDNRSRQCKGKTPQAKDVWSVL